MPKPTRRKPGPKRPKSHAKSRPKPKSVKKAPGPRQGDTKIGTRIRFQGMRTATGKGGVHHFSMETLARAIEMMAAKRDTILTPSFNALLGGSPIAQMVISPAEELEDRYRLHVRASSARKTEAHLGLVVAKRPGDYSKRVEREHANTATCARRAPDRVRVVYKGGVLFMPRLGKSKGGDWHIYVYADAWADREFAIRARDNGQLETIADRPKLLTRDQSERLKQQMFETIIALYEFESGTGIAVRALDPGCWAVDGANPKSPTILLARCPGMVRRYSPARYLNAAMQHQWRARTSDARLAPFDPIAIRKTLRDAWGSEQADDTINAYIASIRKSRYPEPYEGFADELEETGLNV